MTQVISYNSFFELTSITNGGYYIITQVIIRSKNILEIKGIKILILSLTGGNRYTYI